MAKSENLIDKIIVKIDAFQQKNPLLGFPYAVSKKFGEDEANYKCAVVTYYGFWSLLLLLVVATSGLQLTLQSRPELRQKIISSATSYFPIIGEQLKSNVGSLNQVGFALVISLLIAIYSARGGADAFRNSVNAVWLVPKDKRIGFPKTSYESVLMILIGGIGFISATTLSGFAVGLGQSWLFRIPAVMISTSVLFLTLVTLTKVAASIKLSFSQLWPGALFSAIGLQLLQSLGGILVTRQLNRFDSLYGAFAFVLVVLYWLYLQVQIVLYGLEINTVKSMELWPRSLNNNSLTKADKKAFSLYAHKERMLKHPRQKVKVRFKK